MSNFDSALAATETAYNSMGSAVKENEAYLSSIEAKTQAFKAAFQELSLTFINSDLVKGFIDLGTALLKFANSDLGQSVIKLAAFGASLKALGAIVGKLGLIEKFTKLGKAIKSAFIFTTTTQNFSNLYGALGAANQSATALYGTTTKVNKGFVALAKNAKVAVAAMSGLGKIGLAIGAIYGLAKVFMYIAEKPAKDLEKSQSNLEEIKGKMSDVTDEITTLEKKQERLAKSGKELADSEKERLNYLKDQTTELEKQSLTEAKRGLTSAYKALGTVKDPYATGSTQYFQEEKAAQALVNQYKELQEQYKNNKITQAEFVNGADELITRLTPLYNQYEAIIEAGGELTGVDELLYGSIEDIAAAFVNAGGQCSFYNSALATVSSNNTVAKYIVEQFTDSLVEEGGTYKFVSAAARAEAQEVLNLEAQKTKATLQQVNSRIAMRLAEYSSFAGLASKETGIRGRRNSDGSYSYATESEKEAAQLAQTYYKLKSAANTVSKMGVQTSTISSSGGSGGSNSSISSSGGSGGSNSSSSSKAQEESEKTQKILDKLNDKYLESYQRRERIASSYYNKIQKKAWAAYKANKIEYSTYQEYMKDAAKNIFDEIEYRYDNGIYSANTYYRKITYFADKFYKKNGKFNKITYEEYREYIKKATEATLDAVEEQYESGKISGQEYFNQITKLAKEAKDDKILSTKEYKEYVEDAYEKLFDYIEKQYERGKISAKEYYKLIATNGAKAIKAGAMSLDDFTDSLESAAEALKEVAQNKLDAFEFFAEEKKADIDDEIAIQETRIEQLNKQLELMQEQNDALDAQAERMELVNALADAKKQKVRVFDSRYGWIYVSDANAVQEAQDALDEYDEEKRREKAEKAIEDEIESIESLIEQYENQKQAYDDLIEEQTKALERWELEQKLGMSVEEAVLQGRADNFENFKNNYIAAIDEMIAAMQKLTNAQQQIISPSELGSLAADIVNSLVSEKEGAAGVAETVSNIASLVKNANVSDIKRAVTSGDMSSIYSLVGGMLSGSSTSSSKSSVDTWNQNVIERISAQQQSGKSVYVTTDSDGKLHWSTVSASKVSSYSDGSEKTVKVSKTTPVSVKLSTGETIKTTTYKSGKASGSRGVGSSSLYHINEVGDELLVPSTGNLAYLTKGTGVVPAHLTNNLMDIGRYSMSQWASLLGKSGNNTDSHDIIIQNMTVKSDNANDFVRQLQNHSILKK